MTRLLILTAAFGLAASQAGAACDFHQTASKVDTTKVASVTKDDTQKASTPATQPSTTIIEEGKAAPVETE